MPKIFFLDGPAGSGRSTLTPRLLRHFGPRLTHTLRLTTRPPRADDTAYHYIDQVAFGKYLSENRLAAHRKFADGHSYGILREPIEDAVGKGHHVFSLMDLGTLSMLRRAWPGCIAIFLLAPIEVLQERLETKGVHTPEQIAERIGNARKALEKAPYYDYVVPNQQGQLDKVAKHLISILEREMLEEIT